MVAVQPEHGEGDLAQGRPPEAGGGVADQDNDVLSEHHGGGEAEAGHPPAGVQGVPKGLQSNRHFRQSDPRRPGNLVLPDQGHRPALCPHAAQRQRRRPGPCRKFRLHFKMR